MVTPVEMAVLDKWRFQECDINVDSGSPFQAVQTDIFWALICQAVLKDSGLTLVYTRRSQWPDEVNIAIRLSEAVTRVQGCRVPNLRV